MDGYIKLYWWVIEDDNLSMNEKIAYSIILHLSDKDGYCTCGDDYLSQCLHVQKRRMRVIMHDLEEKGYIIRDILKGKRKIYPVEREYIHSHN